MNDIICVRPGVGCRVPRRIRQQRSSLDSHSWPSSFFSLHNPVRWRQSVKITGVAGLYDPRYGNTQKKESENGNAKRVRHAINVAEKAQVRPPPKMWKDSGR